MSETELYYLLKDNLSTEEIIHHGKPKWLGRQHVDIWFPKRKIGIEYQGIQHDQPVEYFGGEEGYKKAYEAAKEGAPLGVTATANTVADSILYFIAGPQIVTGESMIVDGGRHLGMTPLTRR